MLALFVTQRDLESFLLQADQWSAESRFNFRHEQVTAKLPSVRLAIRNKYPAQLRIEKVRLWRRKPYCGQHAGPCRNLIQKPHRNSLCLEGHDWVGFNQLLNDICDVQGLEAHIESNGLETIRHYMIRDGWKRRIEYCDATTDLTIRSFAVAEQVWGCNEPYCFADTREGPHPYPYKKLTLVDGTPGWPDWRRSTEPEWLYHEEDHKEDGEEDYKETNKENGEAKRRKTKTEVTVA